MSRAAAWIVQSSRVVGITLVIWRTLTQGLFNPYRPELHYMRGPGPKWREKHPGDRSLRSHFTV